VPVRRALAALTRLADENHEHVRVVVVCFDGEVRSAPDNVAEDGEELHEQRRGVSLTVGSDLVGDPSEQSVEGRPHPGARARENVCSGDLRRKQS
jgi:hypothetical protein